MKRTVSVIITCYNEGHYVPGAVESIMGQTWVDRVEEIIIVDDGSKDDSVRQLEQLALRNPLVTVIAQENQGLPAARNVAIKRAKGDYIAILDADDLWLPVKLERQLPLLDENPQVGITYTDFCYIFDDRPGEQEKVKCRALNRNDAADALREYFIEDAPIIPSSTVLRRSVVEKVGLFDPYFRHGEDNEMWIRMLAASAHGHVPEPLLHKRCRGDSLGSNAVRRLPYLEQITEKAVRQHPQLKHYAARRTARRLAKTGQYLERVGDASGARAYYRQAIARDFGFRKAWCLWATSCLPRSVAQAAWRLARRARHR